MQNGRNIAAENRSYAPKVPLVILHGIMDSQMWGIWEISDIAAARGRAPSTVSEILDRRVQPDHPDWGRAYDFMFAQLAGGFHGGPLAGQGDQGAHAIREYVERTHGYKVAMPAQTQFGDWDWWNRPGDTRNSQPASPDDHTRAAEAFVLPYDWRHSNNRTGAHLAAALRPGGFIRRHLNRALEGRKFVLVCHSMGGLVARMALEHHGAAADVAALITLGTPHHGSLKLATGLLGYQMGSLNLTKMAPRMYRSVIPRLTGAMELMPHFMWNAFGQMEGSLTGNLNVARSFGAAVGYHSPANRTDRHVPKLTKEAFLFNHPEFKELMGALRVAAPNASPATQAFASARAPSGVRYYCLGVANRYTPYAMDWKPDVQRLTQASATYFQGFDSDWAHRKWNGVRGTLSNITSTAGTITVGNNYPGLRYRVYLDVGDAVGHPNHLVGGDDTVPIESALARSIEGVTARASVNMARPFINQDTGNQDPSERPFSMVDDGHSHMCAEPSVHRVLTSWLTRVNVRQNCVIPNQDAAAASDERRQMGR